MVNILIERIKEKLNDSVFLQYAGIGGTTYVLSAIITTVLLYFGREHLLISLIILNPVIKLFDWLFGFLFKYYMYKRLKLKF